MHMRTPVHILTATAPPPSHTHTYRRQTRTTGWTAYILQANATPPPIRIPSGPEWCPFAAFPHNHQPARLSSVLGPATASRIRIREVGTRPSHAVPL